MNTKESCEAMFGQLCNSMDTFVHRGTDKQLQDGNRHVKFNVSFQIESLNSLAEMVCPSYGLG